MNFKTKPLSIPSGPVNQYSYFIGENPATSMNPNKVSPTIHHSVFIGPFSCIIGDVTINENVFIACNSVLRADEGTPFYIGKNSNIQDGVIFHALDHQYVKVNNKKYAIYVSDCVSCAHGSTIHGPCLIENNVFVGVKAIIFNAIVKSNCFIGTGALITGGVIIESCKFVPPGAVIDTQAKADALGPVPKNNADLAKAVLAVNREFNTSYSLIFGDRRCSCGICCNNCSLLSN